MLPIDEFIKDFTGTFPGLKNLAPWEIIQRLPDFVRDYILHLNNDYEVSNGVAIHRTAKVQQGALLIGPVIVGPNCFAGANSCLRAGVFLTDSVIVGTGCEVKASIIFNGGAIAHFNFIGDSIIGSRVNFEAGSLTANRFNERTDKRISVYYNSAISNTGVEKFGAVVGDDCKIGANAVLSPGTLLARGTIVKRLELIEQVK